MTSRLPVGSRVRFAGERRRYVVQAANERYAVCTKPFAARRTVLYTIVDFVEQVRGTESLIFCLGFETREDCEAALARLVTGESEVSHRNRLPLDMAVIP